MPGIEEEITAEEYNKRVKTMSQQMNDMIKGWEEVVAVLRGKLLKAKEENMTLKGNGEGRWVEIKELRKENQELKEEIEELKEDNREFEEANQGFHEENEELRKKIEELEGDLEDTLTSLQQKEDEEFYREHGEQ